MGSLAALPTITLDTTLADLYKIDENGDSSQNIAFVSCGWLSGSDLGPGMPRNRRFQFHEPATIATSEEECNNFPFEKLRDLQSKFLNLVPQRDSFGIGNFSTIIFTFDAAEGERDSPTVTETLETFRCLVPNQRPRPIFCSGPSELPKVMKDHQIDALVFKIPIDSAEHLPGLIKDATWNYLNSKEAIYDSGLPTAQTVLIEPDFCDTQPQDCCTQCVAQTGSMIPDYCTGPRLPWLKSQVEKVVSQLSAHPLPFVLKTQQSGGGGGTWIIKNQKELSEELAVLSSVVLPKIFSSWTSLNRDLKPANLIIMDYIESPIGNWGITFFITRSGKSIFLSASEQKLNDGKLWYGSAVHYPSQEALERKFTSLMHKITDFVYHKNNHGYYGPIGADVLEVEPDKNTNSTDPDSNYLIVDLNVRVPGSLPLGLLKTHFSTRNLSFATNLFIQFSMDRKEFMEKFHVEYYVKNQIVITAWFHDVTQGQSHVALVVGGETQEALDELIARINELSEDFRL